jgi:hypothetical protein
MSLDTLPTCPLGLTAENLSGWRDGDLSPDRMQRIESHLAACAACQHRLAGFQRIADDLQLIPEPALDVAHFWTDLRLRSAHTPQARRRFAGHRDPRRTFVGLGAVAAVLLITVGFAQLFAFHRIGPSTHSQSTATAVVPTPSATAATTPTAVVTAGRPLSWSRVAFPSAWNQQGAPSDTSAFFGLTPGDESTLYACVTRADGAVATYEFWASHDRGTTWRQVSDLPTHQSAVCTVVVDALAPRTAVVHLTWYQLGDSPTSPRQLAFATTDGGRTWLPLAGTHEYLQLATYQGATYALRLDNPSLLDTGEHLDVSTDGMHTWHTDDQALEVAHVWPHAFWLNPTNGSLLAYASASTPAGLSRSLWVSPNGGHTWQQLDAPDNGMQYLAVRWPTGEAPWHICASDQPVDVAPAQQHNRLACTDDGGNTWKDRPALDITLTCPTCGKGQPFTANSTLALVGIAPDGSVLAAAVDRYESDGTPRVSLFRLAHDATRWESLGVIPSQNPPNIYIYPLPSGLLWLVGNQPPISSMATFPVTSAIYTAAYP